jgi:hypothetical protein
MIRAGRGLMAIGALVALFGATSAEAAMRVCGAFVAGDLATDANEKDAKRRALQSWTEKARALVAHASWHVAAEKALTCGRGPDQSFRCLARGFPCTIRQAPPEGLPKLQAPGRGS